MNVNRKIIAGSGAGALILAGAIYGGTALAQSTTPSTSTGPSVSASSSPSAGPSGTSRAAAGYQDFLQHLAGRLNLSQSQVQAAVKGAATDTVGDAVKAGKLTQTQANRIDQRIQNGKPGFGFGFGFRPPHGALGMNRGAVLTAAAGALNLQPSALRAQLRSGKSLQDVATAQNVSLSTVQAAITSAIKPRLDQAVSSGKITPQQEQKILSRFTSGTFGAKRFGMGHDGPRPASGSPSPSASPSA
ncbi:MAG: hypothetical protein ACYDAG_05470 [Chloroflexota bacterium]